jgi:hypothetical protein
MQRKDLDPLIFRWKKTTRALKIHEQPFGKYVTDILERRTDAELARFSDPVEAAAFFCLLEFVKKDWLCTGEFPASRTAGRGQSLLLPGEDLR